MEAFNKYKNWVRANSGSIAAVEGAVSSLTWLLPDRFSESELLLEAIHSSLGFISLFHETILAAPPTGSGLPQLPWPFWLGALQQASIPNRFRFGVFEPVSFLLNNVNKHMPSLLHSEQTLA